jgi:hypothetical protein
VTSGKHLDPLSQRIAKVFIEAGLPPSSIHIDAKLELPGYFRPTKKWDIVVVHKGYLVSAIELKSFLSSYGNNLNNRTEEAIGSAIDLREAAIAGLVGPKPPWLGFGLIIQDDSESRTRGTRINRPHFDPDPLFLNKPYQKRGAEIMKRLVMKGVYSSAFYLVVDPTKGPAGVVEPDPELTWAKFEAAIKGRVMELLA